jgi:predicted deacylase
MANGIYEPFFDLGESVLKDEPLGQVHFAQHPENEPQIVIALTGGTLIGTRGPGFVEVGDCVALIAYDLR